MSLASTSSSSPSAFTIAAQPFVCSGSAAVFAAICIHPIDLVKVHLQLAGQTGAQVTSLGIAKSVVAHEGIRGLYAGLSAAMVRQMVYGTTRLGLHRYVSDQMIARRLEQGQSGSISITMKSTIATCAGAIAAVMGCPMDVALVRMQADTLAKAGDKRGYKNVFDAIFRIAKSEGVATLWRGSVPLVARGASMNLGMMAPYDQSREILRKYYGDGQTTTLGASAIAGFACAFTSLPFDLVKSRLMNMKRDVFTGKMPYTGVIDCFRSIIVKEGPHRLWRGYWTYYTRCAPNTMIALIMIEQFNALYNKTFLRK